MEQDTHTDFAKMALALALQSQPQMKAAHDAYMKACEYQDERSKSGRLTPRANQARQMLRNPLGVTTAKKKSKKIAARQAADAKAEADELALKAFAARIRDQHCADTLALFDEADANTSKPDVLPSREQHGQAEIDRMARPFVDGTHR